MAYVVSGFPGGTSSFVLDEMEALLEAGQRITVFSDRHIPMRDLSRPLRELERGAVYEEAPSSVSAMLRTALGDADFRRRLDRVLAAAGRGRRRGYGVYARTTLRWAQIMGETGVEHVHAHFAADKTDQALMAHLWTGIPYSFTAHAYDIFWVAYLWRWKSREASFVRTISEFNRRYILEHGLMRDREAGKLHVVRMGVRLPDVNGNGRRRKKDGPFVFLAVANLVWKKGLDILVDAARILASRGLRPCIRLVGREYEPVASLLRSRTAEYGLDNVEILGPVAHGEIGEMFLQSDCFVLPCRDHPVERMDGIPVAMMEAMAYELPVISTRVSGVPELVRSGAGILVDPDDAESLAGSMETVMGFSDEERRRMGREGRRIVSEDFNLAKQTRRLVELFESGTGGRKPPA